MHTGGAPRGAPPFAFFAPSLLRACDPERALDVALRAAAPLSSFTDRDRKYLR